MATGPEQRDRAMLKLNIEAGEFFVVLRFNVLRHISTSSYQI